MKKFYYYDKERRLKKLTSASAGSDWAWRKAAIVTLRELLGSRLNNGLILDESIETQMCNFLRREWKKKSFNFNFNLLADENGATELEFGSDMDIAALWNKMKLEAGGVGSPPALIHACIESEKTLRWAKENGLVDGRDECGRTLLHAMCASDSGSSTSALMSYLKDKNLKWTKQTKACSKSLVERMMQIGGKESLTADEINDIYELFKNNQPKLLGCIHSVRSEKIVKNKDGIKKRMVSSIIHSFMSMLWVRIANARKYKSQSSALLELLEDGSVQKLENILLDYEKTFGWSNSESTALDNSVPSMENSFFKSVLQEAVLRKERKILREKVLESVISADIKPRPVANNVL